MARNLSMDSQYVEDLTNFFDKNIKDNFIKTYEENDKYDSNFAVDIGLKTVEKHGMHTNCEQNKHVNAKQMGGICEDDTLIKNEELEIIDKEIDNFAKQLNDFQSQFEEKNYLLHDSIINLKKHANESDTNAIKFNEEEIKHYFNVHLDQLEDNASQNHKKECNKTWKPFEVSPSPVIDVITSLKPVTKLDKEELHIQKMCDTKSVQIICQAVQDYSSVFPKVKESKSVVPNNSPDILNSVNVSDQNKKIVDEDIALKDYGRILRSLNMKREKKNIKVLKTFFNIWIQYVKYCKNIKSNKMSFVSVSDNDDKSLKEHEKVDYSNSTNRKSAEELNQTSLESSFVLQTVSINKQNCETRIKQPSIVKITPKEKNVKAVDSSCLSKGKTESKVQNKSLIQSSNPNQPTTREVGPKPEENKNISNKIGNNGNKQKQFKPPIKANSKNQEHFANRYVAQGKIIDRLNALIENQKTEIMMLKCQNFEMQRQLKLKNEKEKLVVSQNFVKNLSTPLKPALVTLEKAAENLNKPKRDKSDILTKNLMDRQDHCKQLYEMTKMRKLRMEEEKAKEKLKFEEKEKHRKEEQKRLWHLKIEMEKQLAEENTRNVLAKKIQISNLTNKAVNHYTRVLKKKAFNQLKTLILDITVKSDQCAEMYKRKLLRKVFTDWKQETSQIISAKNNSADTFYNKKLMCLCWNTWRRVSIADGQFKSKL